MIFEALQSELVRFDFHLLRSKLQKIPEFNSWLAGRSYISLGNILILSFLLGISGSLKNGGLSFKRRKRTHLLRRYSHYSVSSTSQAAFFIGGNHGSSQSSVITKYENDNWSLHGNLKRRRSVHGSITYGTTTFVIGGYTLYSSWVMVEKLYKCI